VISNASYHGAKGPSQCVSFAVGRTGSVAKRKTFPDLLTSLLCCVL
jgi:hypothetical protein